MNERSLLSSAKNFFGLKRQRERDSERERVRVRERERRVRERDIHIIIGRRDTICLLYQNKPQLWKITSSSWKLRSM